jgi:hypothetical protein
MAFNAGTLADLMELYSGKGGVNRDKIPRRLLRQIINMKLQEFARRSGCLSSKITRQTVADQQEYELGSDVVNVREVHFDNYLAYKIRFGDIIYLEDKTS